MALPTGTSAFNTRARQHVVSQHLGQQGLVGQQLFLAHAELGQQRAEGRIGRREHREGSAAGQGGGQVGRQHGLDQHAEVGQRLRGLHQAAVGRQQHTVELVDHAVGCGDVGGRDARRAVAAVGDDQLGTRRVDLEDAAGQRADGLADRHRTARHPAAEHVVLQHRGQQRLVGQQLGLGQIEFGEQCGEGGVGGREHREGPAAAERGRQLGGGNGLCQQLRAGVGAQHVDQVARRGVFIVTAAGGQQSGRAKGQQRGATGKSGRNGLHGHLQR
jgi:hypothetical protein